jgi:elongation factor G
MNVYTTDKIRNVAILGNGSCGKTTLVEAMAYLAGITTRMGTIQDGNTISDYDPEEVKRTFSINTSLVPIEWDGTKINLLDTPGYPGFVGEVDEAVAAADAAIIVVNGKAGVEAGTKKAWDLCEKYNLPRIFYVNDMDIDDVSFREVVEELTERYGKKIAPFHLPIRENEKFVGYINVVSMTGYRWNDKGEVEECSIPDYSMENLEKYRETLLEAVAETSEEFMERYFDGDEFSENEIRAALRVNVIDGSITPVTMGSSILCQGPYTMIDDIVKYFPSPDTLKCAGLNVKTNEVYNADYDFSKAKSGYVFKTIVDPFIGKYSLVKVNSGVIKSDDLIYNTRTEKEFKCGKIYTLLGSKQIQLPEVHAGDICALAKLPDTNTGDSLATKNTPVVYGRTEISVPYYYVKYDAKNKGDEDKVSQALQKIMQEDLTVKAVNDSANKQSLLYGMGDIHLSVVVSKLKDLYKTEIELSKPKVSFRETIIGHADVDSKYKKQSGGHGQYGHVKMTFDPSDDQETPYVFEQTVVGGSVPKNYFPAVEKGIAECCEAGPLAGYPVVGVKANLYDGSYHPVDSSEMAFKVAATQAFKDGFMKCNPILLEPIETLKVTVEDQYTGDIMGDLTKRRGRVLGMSPTNDGRTEITAEVPMMEIFDYTLDLRSMTGGTGTYAYEFARYEQAPHDVQEREVAARKADTNE